MHQWRERAHISDVMTPKGDQAALLADGFHGALRVVPTNGDEHLIAPNLPQELVRVRFIGLTVFFTRDTRFDNVKVSEVREPLFGLRDEVAEGRFRVLHSHSLPGVPRGDTESDPVFADGVGDGFDNFEREPGTVLHRSTVFVCPLVRDVLEELVWEVSVGRVELDAVEPGLINGFVGGSGVPLDVGLDFFDRHRAWGRVGRGHGNRGWSDEFEVGVLGLEELDVCGSAESPKLEEDVRAVGVDCVYNLWELEVR